MTKITIDVEIPDGYKFVRFDFPKNGELHIDYKTGNILAAGTDLTHNKYLIVKKLWVKPDWMKPGWIAKDQNGTWHWYSKKPSRYDTYWYASCYSIDLIYVNWTPPENTDWRKSFLEV